MSVLGERIILELNEVCCFELDNAPTPKKGIASTRSFGKTVTNLDQIKEAFAMHVVNAARKLRKQKSVCSYITLYIRSNKVDMSKKLHLYSRAISIKLPYPTDNTAVMLKHTMSAVAEIYESNLGYRKVGIFVTDIMQKDDLQHSFFDLTNVGEEEKGDKLMKSIDKLNNKFGKEMVRYAVEGFKREWKVKAEKVSPRYTTNWNDLMVVKI